MIFRNIAALLLISTTVLPVCAKDDADSGPAQNPHLSAAKYGARHFNPVAPAAFPYAVPTGTYQVDLRKFPRIIGGPTGYLQLASTHPDYLWITTTNGIAYADTSSKRLREVASIATPGELVIPRESLDKLTAQPVASVGGAQTIAKELGVGGQRLATNAHAIVDSTNVLYATDDDFVHAYGLMDQQNPARGIQVLRSFDLGKELKRLASTSKVAALKSSGACITALAMTYDGNLIVGTSRSVTVTSPDFKGALHTVEFGADEIVHNALGVDAKGGIFVASDSTMYKLVWTGKRLSKDAADGAWSSPYDLGRESPTAKVGRGTGATPTLMGFGSDPDKLVVITDGAERMKVVAFWRDAIPGDFKQRPFTKSRRIAGQIEISAGLSPKPEFIQSDQPVVVKGYGAFVVNGVRKQAEKDRLVDVLAAGPVYDLPVGAERVEWDPGARTWRSIWTRGDVVGASMMPAVSSVSDVVLVNGYTKKDGWELTGLAWKNGETIHRSLFGQDPLGNGACALIQFLPTGDLLFNSIGGPIRVHFPAVIARPKTRSASGRRKAPRRRAGKRRAAAANSHENQAS